MSYNLFESYEGIHQPKVSLNNKMYAPIIPQRVTIDFFPYNFVMEASLLIDFIFAISFSVPISIDNYTWEGIQQVFPDFANYLQSLNIPPVNIPPITLLIPPAQANYTQTQMTKCVYGQSKFDYCYYDPYFTIENAKQWLRSGINKVSRNMSTQPIFEGININPHFAEYANRLLNTVLQLLEKTTSLDTMILDYSVFPEHSVIDELALIFPFKYLTQVIELNGLEAYPEYYVLDQVLWGTILDWNPLDASIFYDYLDSAVSLPFRQLVGRIGEILQYMYNPFRTAEKLAFIDPSLPSLPIPPTLSELFQEAFPNIAENAPFAPLTNRAEKWGMAMSLIRKIREIVRRLLSNRVLNSFLLAQYENAGIELCMAFHHNHNRVRFRAYAGIGIDTFKKLWLSKWSSWGLDSNLLNLIANSILQVCLSPIPGFKGVNSPTST